MLTMLWDKVNPIFPFYIPLIALLAMMPVMWVKFRLPSETEKEATGTPGEDLLLGAETSADTSPAAG
jgi:hypothetical protein